MLLGTLSVGPRLLFVKNCGGQPLHKQSPSSTWQAKVGVVSSILGTSDLLNCKHRRHEAIILCPNENTWKPGKDTEGSP